jgi:hypothetical protein
MDAWIKSYRSSSQSFQRHCSGNIGETRQHFGAPHRQTTNSTHRLCAVQ